METLPQKRPKMPKRKRSLSGETSKKSKVSPEIPPCDTTVNITKQNKENQQQSKTYWSDADIQLLLLKIEENVPKDDSVSYSTRLQSFNWDEISVNTHSSKECKEMWYTLSKPIRKFRLLNEIVGDIKVRISSPQAKSSRVLKHPSMPKQPHNSFLLFTEEKRQGLMKQNPELNSVQIAKKLGEMYKCLSAGEKEKYEDQAKVARQEYTVKLQNFYNEHPEFIPKKPNKKGKVVPQVEPSGAPAKPKTPFELFFQESSEKEPPDASKFSLTQKYRELWNNLSDKEKYFWINWAEEQNAKYLDDLKDYIKLHPDYVPEKTKPIITKNEQKIKERCTGKPTKPPPSAYHLFSKMIMESDEVQNIDKKELISYVSEKWRACSDEDKDEYKTRVEQMWEEHHAKLEEYLMTLPPEVRDEVREKESRKKTNKTGTSKTTPVKEKASPKTPPPAKVSKPETPPPTKFKYFLSVYKGKENPTDVWKNMTDEEKEFFEGKLDDEKRKYIALYETYLKSLTREELERLGTRLGHSSGESGVESSDDD